MAKKHMRPRGQKLLPFPVREDFLAEMDQGLLSLGYTYRAQFIRDAILEKLAKAGLKVDRQLAQPEPRMGKSGRRRRPAAVGEC